ncbi:MAG: sigma factor [Planctomycetota bacterium]
MTSPILSELLQRTTALRALARELVGDARADDIVQETAIQTMTVPPKRSGPAGGWLATVVRNLASKHQRAERIRHRHEAKAARAEVESRRAIVLSVGGLERPRLLW